MILCAVDRSDLAPRILLHAIGFSASMHLPLTILHAGVRGSGAEMAVQQALHDAVPYGATYAGDPAVRVEAGDPADVILRVAGELNAELLVLGTRARTGLTRLLLGSTSLDVLQRTDRPVLLIPPTDIEIVTLTFERVGLHFGTVLAAIDLTENNAAQLMWASRMAALARQHLELMTVAPDDGRSDHEVAAQLRQRGHGLQPAPPRAVIVRRGEIAQEIARGAVAEQAGLVVMGLRRSGRGRPGLVAAEVLQTHRALVLAVPEV